MKELYKRRRPKSFDGVVGNEGTVAALQNMLMNSTLPHAILFSGPSGCGKTTLARIVAQNLKCHEADLQELNSASYRGIDSIREIIRRMSLSPMGACRIWILDEVHKLSNDAQNASLKMLEDTPEHVYFLLCTTDPDKLIKPIRTRCTEMSVQLLERREMQVLLNGVCKKEKIKLSEELIEELIDNANGSPRSLLVLLEKIAQLDEQKRLSAIQSRSEETPEVIELCRALMKQGTPWKRIATLLKKITAEPESIRWAVLGYAQAVLLNGKEDSQAFYVIQSFKHPFYDSKMAGLVAACYEVMFGTEE